MLDPIFSGMVKNGKLMLVNKEMFEKYLQSIEGVVQVIVKKRKSVRSLNQNAYYWVAVVGIPAAQFGYTPEEMHEAYKYLFLRREEQGKPTTVRSTTRMTKMEFGQYVDQCRQWCAEQNIIVPDPTSIDL